jgi:hypothetical protein
MFLKIDVEGCEEFIFESFDFFRKYKPIVYVSLHKWWFKDETKGMKTIKEVGKLYKNCYDFYLNKIDIDDNHGGFVFDG